MAEINCDICLTDETLTFVNIANTTTTSKKFKIEAIGHDRIYACLDSDPSATFVNNVYSTCLTSGCFGATSYSGCIRIDDEGLYDLIIDDEIVLTNVSTFDIVQYLQQNNFSIINCMEVGVGAQ